MPQPAPPPIATPTLGQYGALIVRIGLTSFGGGLSGWMLRMVVQQRHWMTEAEFLTGLGLCQVFPGINVLNLAIWMGYRLLGTRGAVVGALCMIVPPGLVIIGLYEVFTGLSDNVPVRVALDGVAAAAIGLGASMGIRAAARCLRPAGTALDPVATAILAGTFAAIALLRLPMLPVMAVVVPLSVGIAWLRPSPAVAAP